MKKQILLAFTVSGLLLISCQKKTEVVKETTVSEQETPNVDTDHTSQNSLDWMGTYESTLPCADCPGIKTTIVLNDNDTFAITNEYLERNTKTEDVGEIMWHDNGSVVHLKGKQTDIKLKVVENGLIHLDQEGKEIDGEFKNLYHFKKK